MTKWVLVTLLALGVLFGLSAYARAGESFWSDDRRGIASEPGDMEAAYGMARTDHNMPLDYRRRDERWNRLIVNGHKDRHTMYQSTDGSVQFGGNGFLGNFNGGVGFSASATAIGNNLSVMTIGSYNTVVIDARQTNNASQDAELEIHDN